VLKRSSDGTVGKGLWNSTHRVAIVRGKLDAEIVLLPNIRRDPELFLRLAVVALQIVVIDRPINESVWAVRVAFSHLEIGWHKPQTRAKPMRGTACDAVIGAGEGSARLTVILHLALNLVTFRRIRPVVGTQRHDGRPAGTHLTRVVGLRAKLSILVKKR